MRGSIAIIVACVGCTSVHTSTLPPYVRDLRASPGGIDMVQCRITFTKKTSQNIMGHTDTELDISEGPCWRSAIPTVVVEAPGGVR